MKTDKSRRAPSASAVRPPSIALRLGAHLLWRLLAAFFALNVFLFAAAFVVTLGRAERGAAAAVAAIEAHGMPAGDALAWLEAGDLRVAVISGEPEGFIPPRVFAFAFPANTARAARRLLNESAEGTPPFGRAEGLVYRLEVSQGGGAYAIEARLGPTALALQRAFIALAAVELLILIGHSASGMRSIRRTLRPISELARAAQSLNSADASSAIDQMRSLAGTLDTINAARLDTRLPLEETQQELRTLAAAINGLLERIDAAYRSQIRFVSDASHELRTPISVIQGYANLLDRWGKNDEKTLQESIDAIRDEAAAMKELVEQLLFLARGDSNTLVLDRERIDLSAPAAEVLRQSQMLDKGHEFTAQLSAVFVDADAALIRQALRILVDNAIKYTPAGGRIHIALTEDAGKALLSVTDEGIGIPPEDLPRIFDRFYRADESRARATGGAGLGLSIAKWIAQCHGGHLEALSRQDIGTRMTIVLDAAEPDPECAQKEAAAP